MRPPARTVEAGTAADVEGQPHAVSLADARHCAADLLHDAHVLVAEHRVGWHERAALVHVEIASTDARGGDADDGVSGLLDARVLHFLHANGHGVLENDGEHGAFSRWLGSALR